MYKFSIVKSSKMFLNNYSLIRIEFNGLFINMLKTQTKKRYKAYKIQL